MAEAQGFDSNRTIAFGFGQIVAGADNCGGCGKKFDNEHPKFSKWDSTFYHLDCYCDLVAALTA